MWAISIHFNSISISFYHLLEVNGEGGFRERQGDGEAATGVKAARSGTVWDLSQGDHDDHNNDDHDVNSDFYGDVGGADHDFEDGDGDGDVDDTWSKVPPLQNPFLCCSCFSRVVQQKN